MAQYNKYRTGWFKRGFAPMSHARIKLLIMPVFEHALCDSMPSRLSKKGIAQLTKEIQTIESNAGIRHAMIHHAITKQGDTIYKC